MLHTPGGLGEQTVPLPQKLNPAPLPTWWGQGEGLCSRKERSLSERRGPHRPHPQSLPPKPPTPVSTAGPAPHSHFLEESCSSFSTRKAGNLGVPYVSLSSCGIGGACAQRGRRGAWASPSWPPSHSRRAGRAGAPSQAVTQRAGYSCGGQL